MLHVYGICMPWIACLIVRVPMTYSIYNGEIGLFFFCFLLGIFNHPQMMMFDYLMNRGKWLIIWLQINETGKMVNNKRSHFTKLHTIYNRFAKIYKVNLWKNVVTLNVIIWWIGSVWVIKANYHIYLLIDLNDGEISSKNWLFFMIFPNTINSNVVFL